MPQIEMHTTDAEQVTLHATKPQITITVSALDNAQVAALIARLPAHDDATFPGYRVESGAKGGKLEARFSQTDKARAFLNSAIDTMALIDKRATLLNRFNTVSSTFTQSLTALAS